MSAVPVSERPSVRALAWPGASMAPAASVARTSVVMRGLVSASEVASDRKRAARARLRVGGRLRRGQNQLGVGHARRTSRSGEPEF